MNEVKEVEIVEGAIIQSGGAQNALAERVTLARPPAVVLEEARQAAVALQDVLAKKPRKVMMNNEQYLEFEDWQTVGRFYGVTAREDGDPEYVQLGPIAGFKASAVAVLAGGEILSRATAYCLNDEEKWRARSKYEYHMVLKDGTTAPEEQSNKSDWVWEPNPNKDGNRPKRERVLVGEEPVPLFQLASMAQTRANAKVLRNVLAWVVVLAGYRPTPAEEIDAEPNARTETAAKPPAGNGGQKGAPVTTESVLGGRVESATTKRNPVPPKHEPDPRPKSNPPKPSQRRLEEPEECEHGVNIRESCVECEAYTASAG